MILVTNQVFSLKKRKKEERIQNVWMDLSEYEQGDVEVRLQLQKTFSVSLARSDVGLFVGHVHVQKE